MTLVAIFDLNKYLIKVMKDIYASCIKDKANEIEITIL